MTSALIDYTTEPQITTKPVTSADINAAIEAPLNRFPSLRWWIAIAVTLSVLAFGLFAVTIIQLKGLGVAGFNQPVAWAFDVTNFVFWVGIGHAGTLISAILFLMRQRWRNAIARFAEAMPIFAVMFLVLCLVIIDMLKGDMDPEMFHQPNLHAYDGTHSILGDLYDEVHAEPKH